MSQCPLFAFSTIAFKIFRTFTVCLEVFKQTFYTKFKRHYSLNINVTNI